MPAFSPVSVKTVFPATALGRAKPVGEGNGGLAYWGVPDAAIALQQLSAAGASIQGALQDVGDGIRVASVRDPFGNILGVIENPHFKLPT